MGYRPPVPWSMPDQDEPETWASWETRHRPPVHFQEDERKPEPEAGIGAWCFFGMVAIGAGWLFLRFAGVL